MKRIILLLMCVFTLSCLSAQTVGDGKKKNKNDNFRTIKTDSGKSVLPSYRSKKHLDLLKGRYNSPVMSDCTPYAKTFLILRGNAAVAVAVNTT